MPLVEISTAFAVKLKVFAASSALMAGATIAYVREHQNSAEGKLKAIFDICGLFIEKESLLTKKYRVYPRVHHVDYGANGVTAVFSIPFGVNPELVDKALWAFRQKFGEDTELSRVGQRFTLTSAKRGLPTEVPYNSQEIACATVDMRLPIVVGRSDTGYEAYDMVDFPHLLIAGETGSGKSTQLRAILTNLIMSKSPDDLRLILADMKRSEFHLFRNVSHVESVITTQSALHRTLLNVDRELRRRGDLLDAYEVSHIDDYNDISGVEKEPYIVVCIDEVAMLQRQKAIMAIIEDISAIGRALGVFLILSMQRPDAKVLDGKLKNNLTVRMAFRHSDEINSRITIGSGEAADIKITERGRMIYKRESLVIVQGPYLSLDEAKRMLSPHKTLRRSFGNTQYFDMEGEVFAEDVYESEKVTKEQPIFGLLTGGDSK